MPAVNLFTGATKTTAEDPYATQGSAPAPSTPAPIASDPTLSAAPLGGSAPATASTSQPMTTTQPISPPATPAADRPWWEQARSNLGEMISPGPHTPAPEPRDPYTKPETPSVESQGFATSTASDWEYQQPDGTWAPYPSERWDLPTALQTGGKVKDPTFNWNDYEWNDAEILRYDPGTTWNVTPTRIINGTTQVYDPVIVRRRDGSARPDIVGSAPGSAESSFPGAETWVPGTEPAITTNAAAPATSMSPETSMSQTPNQSTTWNGYLSGPPPAQTTTSSTQPHSTGTTSPAPAPSQPYAATPATQPPASAPSTTTYRGNSSSPAVPQRATYSQDAGNASAAASGGYDGYFYDRRDAGAIRRGEEIFDDPIFARFFQVLSQQHGTDRARQMIREMTRTGRTSRGARGVSLVPGENGFLENLTRR